MSTHETKYVITAAMVDGKRVKVKQRTVAHRPGTGMIYRAVGPVRDPKVMTCPKCYPPQRPIDNRHTKV